MTKLFRSRRSTSWSWYAKRLNWRNPWPAPNRWSFLAAAPERLIGRTEPGKVRQILLNILGNAVKFIEEGEIRLEVEAEEESVVIRVSDTGIGIPPEHQATIFEPFLQVEQAPSRRTAGTGLGLSVTRQLSRLLGGETTVESSPGRGSTFTVRLPLRAPEPAANE